MKNMGETKVLILRSCVEPKRWTDLVGLVKKSDPTMKAHLDDLFEMKLLEKNNRKYQTTKDGIKQLHLVPHFWSQDLKKTTAEILDMASYGITPGFTLKEKLKVSLAPGIFIGNSRDKVLRSFYQDLVNAMHSSLVVWTPKGVKPDKELYKIIHKLISKQMELIPSTKQKRKFRITIDVDLPLGLDSAIREEKNEEVRNKIIDNKETILEKITGNWYDIAR